MRFVFIAFRTGASSRSPSPFAAAEGVARLQVEHVRVGALADEAAGAALAAGPFVERPALAVEQARQLQREQRAARARGPGEQQGVGRLVHARDAAQRPPRALVPDDGVHARAA